VPEKSIIHPVFPTYEKISTRLAIVFVIASGITFSTTSIANENMLKVVDKLNHHNISGSLHNSYWDKKRITMIGESLISYLPRDAKRSERLVHSSFRLRQDVLKSLEIEARKRGVTISSLVNKILENYMTSEIYFEELGFMLMSKGFLRKTFDGVTERRAEELGKDLGLTVAKEYVSYFFPEVNMESLLKFLELWFKRFQSFSHRMDNNRHYFTINHEINTNFSIILKAMLEGIIEPIAKRTVSFRELTPNTIVFSFEIS
jgi:hypothetical protein